MNKIRGTQISPFDEADIARLFKATNTTADSLRKLNADSANVFYLDDVDSTKIVNLIYAHRGCTELTFHFSTPGTSYVLSGQDLAWQLFSHNTDTVHLQRVNFRIWVTAGQTVKLQTLYPMQWIRVGRGWTYNTTTYTEVDGVFATQADMALMEVSWIYGGANLPVVMVEMHEVVTQKGEIVSTKQVSNKAAAMAAQVATTAEEATEASNPKWYARLWARITALFK